MCLWGPYFGTQAHPSTILAPLANHDQMQESLNTASNNNSKTWQEAWSNISDGCVSDPHHMFILNQKHQSWQLIIQWVVGVQLVKMFCICLARSPQLTPPYLNAAVPQVNSNTSHYPCKTLPCRWPNTQGWVWSIGAILGKWQLIQKEVHTI